MTDGDQLLIDSQTVRKAFKKAHKNVLRDIDGMRDSTNQVIAEHYRLNFEPIQTSVNLGLGRSRAGRAYRMTKDGFAELAMSFTGEASKVIRCKVAGLVAGCSLKERSAAH